MTATKDLTAIEDAALQVLDQQAFFAKAIHNFHEPVLGRTPDRPDWWNGMSVQMRDLAEAALEAGVWEIPA